MVLRNLIILLGLIFIQSTAFAEKEPGKIPGTTEITENLGDFIDLSLDFIKEDGSTRKLSKIIPFNRPYIIVPVYYRCPRLCSLTLNSLKDSLKEINLVLGEDYSVLTVSFNPEESPELALAKGQSYHDSFDPDLANFDSWPFLLGSKENTESLMKQLGFSYAADGDVDFSHASTFMVLSPEGKISRYFYGFPIKPQDLRLALVEASEGIIGSTFDRVLLYCFRYDHTKGQYTPVVMNLVRAVGLGSLFGVTFMIVGLWRRRA